MTAPPAPSGVRDTGIRSMAGVGNTEKVETKEKDMYATATKTDAAPPLGLAGLAQIRAITRRAMVAIGGIGHEDARSVIHSGAYSTTVEEVPIRSFWGILRPIMTVASSNGQGFPL